MQNGPGTNVTTFEKNRTKWRFTVICSRKIITTSTFREKNIFAEKIDDVQLNYSHLCRKNYQNIDF
jgi:hypothetical protein